MARWCFTVRRVRFLATSYTLYGGQHAEFMDGNLSWQVETALREPKLQPMRTILT
jgi:hypothetical protein